MTLSPPTCKVESTSLNTVVRLCCVVFSVHCGSAAEGDHEFRGVFDEHSILSSRTCLVHAGTILMMLTKIMLIIV